MDDSITADVSTDLYSVRCHLRSLTLIFLFLRARTRIHDSCKNGILQKEPDLLCDLRDVANKQKREMSVLEGGTIPIT